MLNWDTSLHPMPPCFYACRVAVLCTSYKDVYPAFDCLSQHTQVLLPSRAVHLSPSLNSTRAVLCTCLLFTNFYITDSTSPFYFQTTNMKNFGALLALLATAGSLVAGRAIASDNALVARAPLPQPGDFVPLYERSSKSKGKANQAAGKSSEV